MMSKTSKRILSVTVKRIADYDADTSDLGEFSDREAKQYAIVSRGEYSGQFVDQLPCECEHDEAGHYGDNAETDGPCQIDGCDCEDFDRVEVHGDSRLAKYFNPPVDNYKGIDDAELRKYCLQDYERMRDLERGEWCFIGIKAQAIVQLTSDLAQTVSSGGIWGVESDQSDSDFRMIETEELDQLKAELHEIGFTKRAIAAAFRDVKRDDD